MSENVPLPTLRWLGPLALLLAEYLWVTLQFDALPLLHSSGLSGEFGHLGIAAPLFLVGLAAYLALGWRRADRAGRGLCVHCGYDRRQTPLGAPCPECGKP